MRAPHHRAHTLHEADGTRAAGTATRLAEARLRRVVDFIDMSLDRDVTVAEMAAIACLSRYHFSRAFRRATGLSPHAYLAVRRLDRAKHLLRSGSAPLADIALACRFSDQSTFTRAFRRATGTTPGCFRSAAAAQHTKVGSQLAVEEAGAPLSPLPAR